MSETYPRDMTGYGRNWPQPGWPGDARIAVQFVINYEEGAENNVLHGDPASESLLSEFGFAVPRPGQRSLPVESMYEYGTRVGFWRLHRLFTERRVPITVNAVAMALERNPRPDDNVAEFDGIKVVIDPASLPYIDGSTIDYVDSLMGAGFAIHNPHAVTTCSCGQSFRTAGAAGSPRSCGSGGCAH